MTDIKMIARIAKTELRNLFYSPVAWFLAVAFMVQCAMYYCSPLVYAARWQDIAQKNMPKFKNLGTALTAQLFLGGGDSLFRNALQNLYLFIPLLTMGLISREVNNGTIKMLYSSPVRTREIVLGKYLAIMLYNLMLVLVIGVFMGMGIMHIEHADYGMLLSATLAFYLLVCTYTAIGLFMSSLTTYQIVSAIGSFIVILILTRIGGLWQRYEFVRDLTYFLSIYGRTGKMLQGLITTKDVIYFLLLIFMFIGFTIIKMRAGRESRPWFVSTFRYTGIVVIVLGIGYISSRPANVGYWDTTAGDFNTLHPNVQKVLREMDQGPLEVTLYTNLLAIGAQKGFPDNRNEYLTSLWEPYLRFKPNIKFNYVYYYDTDDKDSSLYRRMPGKNLGQIAQQIANGFDVPFSLFQSPAVIRKQINLQPEGYRLVMELKYNGRRTFLRTFTDNLVWPENEQVAPALKRLLPEPLPKLIFLTGNLERDIHRTGERDYHRLIYAKDSRESMINLGFDADTLSGGRPIPGDASVLVLADPKTELDSATRGQIRRYIDNGGNMMVLGEPGKLSIINPVLSQLGVRLDDGTLIEQTPNDMPDMVKPYVTKLGLSLAQDGISQAIATQMIEGDTLLPLNFSGVAPVLLTDSSAFDGHTLLATMPGRDWLKKGKLVADSAVPVFNASEGDSKQLSYTTAMAISRMVGKREQRIVVCGDADFLSDLRQRDAFLFPSRAMFCWLNYSNFPIYAPESIPQDKLLRIHEPTAIVVRLLFVWIIPGLVTLSGIILLVRRKRK